MAMQCAICGKEFERLTKVDIEGSVANVCLSCVKFGNTVEVTEEQLYKKVKKDAVQFSRPVMKKEYEK